MARRRGYRRKFKFKLKGQTIRSIIAVLLFFAGALMLLSLIGGTSGVENSFSTLLSSFFGYGAILLPFILITLGLYLSRFEWDIARPRVFVGLAVLFLGVSALLHLFYLEDGRHAAALGKGGGYLGNYLAQRLVDVISRSGAFLTVVATVVIGILMLFNTSLDSLFKKASPLMLLLSGIYNKTRQTILEKRAAMAAKSQKLPTSETPESAAKTPETSFKVYGEEPHAEHSLNNKDKDEASIEVIRPGIRAGGRGTSNASDQGQTADSPLGNSKSGDKPLGTDSFDPSLWKYPPLSLLNDKPGVKAERGDVKEKATIIEKTLESFGIRAQVVEVNLGPAVTQYALDISEGTKISKITSLQTDIALALAAPTGTVRIEAPIPGKSLVGIEVPNYSPSMVTLKSILSSNAMENTRSKLTVGMGHDVAGQPVVADLARMPHVLVAGTTGSGKSVMLNSFIATLLFRTHPGEVKMILVDPKRVELVQYQDIPHLLTPVIVDAEKVLSSLKWAIEEMQKRYRIFEQERVKNIAAYNEKMGQIVMPYIVIVIDEMADLMMYAPTEVEAAICRLAQLSRATGIHLVLATQRPSVDVITGLIKANIPCRVAFNVSSGTDSRVILDQLGAEKLLGRGDMLYLPPDTSKPFRIQGVYTSDQEVTQLIEFIKRENAYRPEYHEEIMEYSSAKLGSGGEPEDDLFNEAVKVICNYDRASASLLQRRLRVGYARAARLLDELEERGVISPKDGSKPREVLVRSAEEYFGPPDEDHEKVE